MPAVQRSQFVETAPHSIINYIDTKEKGRHLNNLLQMDFAAGVYLSETPPLLGFCLGWSSNFIGSESNQIQCTEC